MSYIYVLPFKVIRGQLEVCYIIEVALFIFFSRVYLRLYIQASLKYVVHTWWFIYFSAPLYISLDVHGMTFLCFCCCAVTLEWLRGWKSMAKLGVLQNEYVGWA
uniref:Uncharacterized protein n=1 Tax=Arundo donax TaxID=35708 RepID=A0A0A9EBR8_ARUDO